MYNHIFYILNSLSKFLKSTSFIFSNSYFDSILLLAILEFLNISTVWIYFNLNTVLHTVNVDAVVCILLLVLVNYLYFGIKKRYIKIIQRCNDNSHLFSSTIKDVAAVVYIVATIYLFFKVS